MRRPGVGRDIQQDQREEAPEMVEDSISGLDLVSLRHSQEKGHRPGKQAPGPGPGQEVDNTARYEVSGPSSRTTSTLT